MILPTSRLSRALLSPVIINFPASSVPPFRTPLLSFFSFSNGDGQKNRHRVHADPHYLCFPTSFDAAPCFPPLFDVNAFPLFCCGGESACRLIQHTAKAEAFDLAIFSPLVDQVFLFSSQRTFFHSSLTLHNLVRSVFGGMVTLPVVLLGFSSPLFGFFLRLDPYLCWFWSMVVLRIGGPEA